MIEHGTLGTDGRTKIRTFLAPLALLLASCSTIPPAQNYDVIIRGGTIVD